MAVLDEIAAYLAAQGHGTVGTNIFIQFMGDQPDQVTALYNIHVAEDPIDTFGDGTVPVIDHVRFQIRTRAASRRIDLVETWAENMWKDIVSITNQTVGGRYYHRIMKTSGPFLLEIDRTDRPTYVTNFKAMFTP